MHRHMSTSEKITDENYLATQTTAKKSGAKIQDAHEAIRPSDINRTPAMVKDSLSRDQFRLYQLIWKRFCSKPHGICGI